jgi:hypothetical protein
MDRPISLPLIHQQRTGNLDIPLPNLSTKSADAAWLQEFRADLTFGILKWETKDLEAHQSVNFLDLTISVAHEHWLHTHIFQKSKGDVPVPVPVPLPLLCIPARSTQRSNKWPRFFIVDVAVLGKATVGANL